MPSDYVPSPLYDRDFEHDACGVGFIAQISGERSHDVLAKALTALKSLAHRGAIDADASTGDGAGVLTQLPYELIRAHIDELKLSAPAEDRDLALGMLFLPRGNDQVIAQGKKIVIEAVKEEGLNFIGWRDVPVDFAALGRKAADTRPAIVQAIVARYPGMSDEDFERHLFLAQNTAERRALADRLDGFYFCSFSSQTVVYKGLLNAPEVRRFFVDLRDPRFKTAFVIFHQRYSTNTFPTWHLAQPFRMLAHNGEINTIRGNRVRMKARGSAGGHNGLRSIIGEMDTEVFARLPEALRRHGEAPAWGAANHPGKELHSFLEGPSFDRAGNLYVVDIPYGRVFRVSSSGDFATVADLRRAYDPAWPTLDRWVAYVAPALNQLLRALMAILDPAAIVFGGEAPVDLRRRLIAVSQRRVPDRLGRPVPTPALLQSAIGSDASALGAALFPIRHRLFAAANGGSGGSGAG